MDKVHKILDLCMLISNTTEANINFDYSAKVGGIRVYGYKKGFGRNFDVYEPHIEINNQEMNRVIELLGDLYKELIKERC